MPEKLELKRGRLFSSPLFLSFQSPLRLEGVRGWRNLLGKYAQFTNFLIIMLIKAILMQLKLKQV